MGCISIELIVYCSSNNNSDDDADADADANADAPGAWQSHAMQSAHVADAADAAHAAWDSAFHPHTPLAVCDLPFGRPDPGPIRNPNPHPHPHPHPHPKPIPNSTLIPNQVCDFPFERLLCWRGGLGLGLPLLVRRAVLPLLLALGGLTVL